MPTVSSVESGRDVLPQLTDREWDILELVSEGLTDQQIATRASVSTHTVNFHLRRLFAKFKVNSRVKLASIYSSGRRRAA